ncbi:HD domain-containing protein [Actinacidiphila alni]|uniref:HD-GYP domain-containing protein n=1 Tax=Actinacidiphila alni TaxID=380248 RepID=UPI0033DD2721
MRGRMLRYGCGVVLALTLAAVLRTALHGLAGPGTALAFGLVVALGVAFRLPAGASDTYLPDRDAAPLATAASLAYALLSPGSHSVPQTVAVVAASAALAHAATPHHAAHAGPAAAEEGAPHGRGELRGWGHLPAEGWGTPPARWSRNRPRLPHWGGFLPAPRMWLSAQFPAPLSGTRFRKRSARPRAPERVTLLREARVRTHRTQAPPRRGDAEVRRVTAAGFAAICVQPLGGAEGAVLAVLGLTALCDAALAAAIEAARTGHPYAPALRDELRALPGIGSAVCAGAAVMALAVTAAGLWAVPVVAVPLLLTQLSLRGHAAVRATYRQTIGSLARATEVAGYTPPGHARRVSELSAAVGRELGLPARHLILLEYAALMHDIGQLSLVDPVPRGATEPLDGERQRTIAALGGEVVRQTGAPAEVALIVERQAHPYREQPLAGRIVRAVNAYEDLTGEPGAALDRRLAALERLRLATAREYDPQVVAALTRVLARRPTWAWLDAHGSGKGVE